jgi:plasmid stabilization system protein ParE
MKIIWIHEAKVDLLSVRAHITRDSEVVAKKVVEKIMTYAESQLTLFPYSGKVGRCVGTYEIKVPKLPYYVPYRIKINHIEILRVYHTSRVWPAKVG